jgi:hypothetical protein
VLREIPGGIAGGLARKAEGLTVPTVANSIHHFSS